jgi:hypothetical protein
VLLPSSCLIRFWNQGKPRRFRGLLARAVLGLYGELLRERRDDTRRFIDDDDGRRIGFTSASESDG